MFPRSGGEKVYLEASYKHPRLLATVIFAFQVILLGFTASGCIVFASNIVVAAGRSAAEWEKRGIAIAVIVFVTILHTFFPKVGVQEVLNSYAGWSNAAYVLNEVKNPVRTLKIAGPLGLATCGTLYILANVSYFSAATPEELSASGITVASYFMLKVFGSAAQRALSVLVAISALGNVMTVTFAQARVNQELAKEGVIPFPKFWASSWPFGSPSAGLLLHFIPSFIVIVAIPFGDAYSFILDVEGYPGSVVNLFVVIGYFWLRYSAPKVTRPFRCWWPVAAFYLVAQCFLLIAPFLRPPGGKGDTSLPYWLYPIVGIAILLGGVAYWAIWWKILPSIGKYKLEPIREKLKDGTTVVVYHKVKGAE
ncbi:hypothetical protein DV737_g4955, partial [Chaetothyriales sp. CBS 132003]